MTELLKNPQTIKRHDSRGGGVGELATSTAVKTPEGCISMRVGPLKADYFGSEAGLIGSCLLI